MRIRDKFPEFDLSEEPIVDYIYSTSETRIIITLKSSDKAIYAGVSIGSKDKKLYVSKKKSYLIELFSEAEYDIRPHMDVSTDFLDDVNNHYYVTEAKLYVDQNGTVFDDNYSYVSEKESILESQIHKHPIRNKAHSENHEAIDIEMSVGYIQTVVPLKRKKDLKPVSSGIFMPQAYKTNLSNYVGIVKEVLKAVDRSEISLLEMRAWIAFNDRMSCAAIIKESIALSPLEYDFFETINNPRILERQESVKVFREINVDYGTVENVYDAEYDSNSNELFAFGRSIASNEISISPDELYFVPAYPEFIVESKGSHYRIIFAENGLRFDLINLDDFKNRGYTIEAIPSSKVMAMYLNISRDFDEVFDRSIENRNEVFCTAVPIDLLTSVRHFTVKIDDDIYAEVDHFKFKGRNYVTMYFDSRKYMIQTNLECPESDSEVAILSLIRVQFTLSIDQVDSLRHKRKLPISIRESFDPKFSSMRVGPKNKYLIRLTDPCLINLCTFVSQSSYLYIDFIE